MSKRTELRSYAPGTYTVSIREDHALLSSQDFTRYEDAAEYQRLHEQGIKMEARAKRDSWLRIHGIRRSS